jgi:cytochrome c peroxidase
MLIITRCFVIAATIGLISCSDSNNNTVDESTNSSLNTQVRAAAASSTSPLTGDPTGNRFIPSIETPLSQLGMKLFFSRSLSGEKDVACASCHHPKLMGGDALSLSIGTEAEDINLLGPGRAQSISGTNYDGLPTVPRNAPTTFNIAIWDKFLFLDGRVEALFDIDGVATGEISTPDSGTGNPDPLVAINTSLDAVLARFPVTSNEEMRGFSFEAGQSNENVRQHLTLRLQGAPGYESELAVNNWLDEFRSVFNKPTGTAAELITYDNISLAMSSYQRSQWFVSNPWNDFLKGDDTAISDDAKQGALLFLTPIENGGAGCSACHSGDRFSNEGFASTAAPQVGRGKGDTLEDFGRFNITSMESDRYKFRIPSLLNVAETGPWTHSGAYTDLTAMVKHYSNIENAVTTYDVTQLDFVQDQATVIASTQGALDGILAARVAALNDPSITALQDAQLTDNSIDQIVAFLKTLTDPCIKDPDCINQWVPDTLDSDPDAMRLSAKDNLGNPLN